MCGWDVSNPLFLLPMVAVTQLNFVCFFLHGYFWSSCGLIHLNSLWARCLCLKATSPFQCRGGLERLWVETNHSTPITDLNSLNFSLWMAFPLSSVFSVSFSCKYQNWSRTGLFRLRRIFLQPCSLPLLALLSSPGPSLSPFNAWS